MSVRDPQSAAHPLNEATGHESTRAQPPRDPNRRYGRSPAQSTAGEHSRGPAAQAPEASLPPVGSAQEERAPLPGGAGQDEGPLGRPDAPEFDAEYRRWREEHVRMLDSEYAQWRQERYRQFAQEFSQWRQRRQAPPPTSTNASSASTPRPEPMAPVKQAVQAPHFLDNSSALGPVADADTWPAHERLQERMQRERASRANEGGGGGLLSQLLGGGRERHKPPA
jgi:hypothetical protein